MLKMGRYGILASFKTPFARSEKTQKYKWGQIEVKSLTVEGINFRSQSITAEVLLLMSFGRICSDWSDLVGIFKVLSNKWLSPV